MKKQYLCIDLKSFYASVECIERNLDPLTTNLIVADQSRTEKTICLAVTPSLKSYGIPGRPRLFEVIEQIKNVNAERKLNADNQCFKGESYDAIELKYDPSLAVSYVIAPPRMAYYIEYSTRIYNVYLKYIAPEDIHVYSIDEVFMDVTGYLNTNKMTAHELAMTIIRDVLKETGITATAGIGTNMYLAKIAMDIVAKKMPADKDGVRIAELDELSYRKELWSHTPLVDFWGVGSGYVKKLEEKRIYTMGDIARMSLTPYGEAVLYKMFGVNAELLIDHAWGWEPCSIADVKAYKPESKSICSGQVLHCPYDFDKARLVLHEMTELLALDLVEKGLVCDQIVLTIGYDIENVNNSARKKVYKGEITTDRYGRKIPKHAHGTANIYQHTSSAMLMIKAVLELYDKIVDKKLLIRRINLSANHLMPEGSISLKNNYEQLDLFADYGETHKEAEEKNELEKERIIQKTTVELRNRFGKNAVIKGTNLQEGATALDRNGQIGGHKA